MNFMDSLKNIDRWVCWDFEAFKAWDIEAAKRWDALSEEEKAKPSLCKKKIKNPHKKPLQINGYGASSTNSATWNTYTNCESSKFKGLGFVLSDIDDIVAIDIDHCRNKDSGKLTDYALYILKLFSSLTETSQSQTGLHIFCRGKIPQAMKTKTIEIYSTERYICTTGDILLDIPIINAQQALDNVFVSHKTHKKRNIKIEKQISISSSELDTLLENKRFQKLWDREVDFLKDGGGYDWSLFDFHIALALREVQPEKVISVQQMFRAKYNAPKKHKGALINSIQKTNIWVNSGKCG